MAVIYLKPDRFHGLFEGLHSWQKKVVIYAFLF